MGEQSCKLKIILDGGSAVGYAQAIVDMASAMSDEDTAKLTDKAAYPIIKAMIEAEHQLEKAHNGLLDVVGYDGPRP